MDRRKNLEDRRKRDSVTPYWAVGKIARGSIGNLRFYGGYEAK